MRSWRKKFSVGLAFAAALSLHQCALPKSTQRPADDVVRYSETGVASFYAGKFHGRLTANGELFNTHAMTAAHPKLPFGTMVRVTNLRNGRRVKVRINDRGPFSKGRIIDLSKMAAIKLGMKDRGIARVRIEVLYN